ncbi:pentapeptide repeat-containing protein [Enterocloster sp.]|uniref:pentapeptide repeat-containing protein n=1 Tax=Enterocloster sp. TaxID=2719315 RepID=UPI0039A07021
MVSLWYEAELQDSDCSGKALCFLQFENCSLQNMNFGKADLIGARFRNCTLKTWISGSNIKADYFEDCKWDQCDFQGRILQNVFFEDDIPFCILMRISSGNSN